MTELPDLARQLDMAPHPEGGWFKETWRSHLTVPQSALPPDYTGPRSAGTAILFLLMPGQQSAWHTVRSAEVWLYHSRRPIAPRGRPRAGHRHNTSARSRHLGAASIRSSSCRPDTGSAPVRVTTSPASSAASSCRASTSPTSRSARLPTEQLQRRGHQVGVSRRRRAIRQPNRVLQPDSGLQATPTRVFQ